MESHGVGVRLDLLGETVGQTGEASGAKPKQQSILSHPEWPVGLRAGPYRAFIATCDPRLTTFVGV